VPNGKESYALLNPSYASAKEIAPTDWVEAIPRQNGTSFGGMVGAPFSAFNLSQI